MPKWIEERAKHIRDKNPDMPESQSWAIATQQAYATKKVPSSYGTKEGRNEAKKKYDEPRDSYVKTPNPKEKTSGLDPITIASFSDELFKIASSPMASVMKASRTLPKMPKMTNAAP